MENSVSLYDLNHRIREVINDSLSEVYWVIAEISELKVNISGHCYLELVEKDDDSPDLKARARATIWANTYRILKPYFESTTRNTFEAGIKILVKCTVEFHEVYGLSLNIQDIDPAYTIGELTRKRGETIRRLENEGVISMNKELVLPLVPQRIAVISSESAAGYQDFIRQLKENEYGIKYYYKLFPAYMQGTESESSIIHALDKVYEYEDFFDAVTIIRGGGSQADLTCFDAYQLAYYITQFPLPVITGIGHDKDESVTDIVAHTQLKTPTAVADFIIQKAVGFIDYLTNTQHKIMKVAEAKVQYQKMHLENISNVIALSTKNILATQQFETSRINETLKMYVTNYLKDCTGELKQMNQKIQGAAKYILTNQNNSLTNQISSIPIQITRHIQSHKNRLGSMEKAVHLLNPEMVLKRGFSITTANGKIIKESNKLKQGDLIKTTYFRGKSISKIEKTE